MIFPPVYFIEDTLINKYNIKNVLIEFMSPVKASSHLELAVAVALLLVVVNFRIKSYRGFYTCTVQGSTVLITTPCLELLKFQTLHLICNMHRPRYVLQQEICILLVEIDGGQDLHPGNLGLESLFQSL